MNHRLKLAIVDVCKAMKPARDIFALLESLYVFMSRSATRSLFVDVQKRLCLSVVEQQRLSDIRWACRVAACTAVMKTFPAILVPLAEVIATKSRRATEARGLLEQLNISFLFNLRLFTRVLRRLKILSDFRQSKDCDLARACLMGRAAIDEFADMRNSEQAFESVWAEGCKSAEENGVPSRQAQRATRLPAHL
ncbi:unnamed protein product [Ixodes pacificus]